GMSLVAEAVDGVAPARAGGGMSRLKLRAAPRKRRQASVRTSARVHELVDWQKAMVPTAGRCDPRADPLSRARRALRTRGAGPEPSGERRGTPLSAQAPDFQTPRSHQETWADCLTRTFAP